VPKWWDGRRRRAGRRGHAEVDVNEARQAGRAAAAADQGWPRNSISSPGRAQEAKAAALREVVGWEKAD